MMLPINRIPPRLTVTFGNCAYESLTMTASTHPHANLWTSGRRGTAVTSGA
jgi:hypothetical protein